MIKIKNARFHNGKPTKETMKKFNEEFGKSKVEGFRAENNPKKEETVVIETKEEDLELNPDYKPKEEVKPETEEEKRSVWTEEEKLKFPILKGEADCPRCKKHYKNIEEHVCKVVNLDGDEVITK